MEVITFFCRYCSDRFVDVDSLLTHLRGCTSFPQGPHVTWQCGNCPSILGSRGRLREHLIRVHHPSSTRWSTQDDSVADGSSPLNSSFISTAGTADDNDDADVSGTASEPASQPSGPFILPQAVPIMPNPEIVSMLTRDLAAIAADSLQDTGMTEKNVQFFMNRFMHYQQTVHSVGLENLYKRFSAPGSGSRTCCTNTLNSFLNEHKSLMESAFKPMRSTHSRMAYFVQQGSYVPPQPIFAKSEVAAAPDVVRLTDRDVHVGFGQKDHFVHVIPMRQVLTKLFQIPGFLMEVLIWHQQCARHPKVTCFQRSDEWLTAARQRDCAKPGSYFFPINIFYDDFEAGNALGSHSAVHKLGGVYFSLPFVPPHMASKLRFILLAAVFKSRVREVEGNKAVFGPIINELNFLYERGITVTVEGGRKVDIQFGLGVLIGDNLGLNSMLGFTTSFNSQRCCRVCRISKDQYNTTLREDPRLLRTNDNFMEDLEANTPRDTGVVDQCVWREIPYFRLERHCSVDFMHDMFEGCAKYVMLIVLGGLIHRNSVFTLSFLNDRIKNIQYGPDSGTKPLSIGSAAGQGFNMRMSASEMRTFIAYFGLMVGHLITVNDYDPDTLGTTEAVPQMVIPECDVMGDVAAHFDDDDAGDDDDDVGAPSTSHSARSRMANRSTKRPPSGTSKRVPKRMCKEIEGDAADFYKLYLLLNQVINGISQDSVEYFRSLELADTIESFLSRFIRLSNLLSSESSRSKGGAADRGPPIPVPLQPKFHFLTHYPSMMLKHGPLTALSSFRFESKNKQLKTGLKNSFNNINTPYSAAKKEQYHLNHLFFHNTLPSRLDQPGKCYPITDNAELLEVSQALGLDTSCLFSIRVLTTYDGIKFVPGYVVALEADNRGLPVFSKIVTMYFDKSSNETYFKGEGYTTVALDPHYRAYALQPLHNSSYHKLSYRLYPFPNTLVQALDYEQYVVMRNSLM